MTLKRFKELRESSFREFASNKMQDHFDKQPSQKIGLNQISCHQQARTYKHKVDNIRTKIKAGKKILPIAIYKLHKDHWSGKKYVVANGHNRYKAHDLKGKSSISAKIMKIQ